jgi:hypothetical protein
MTPLSWCIVISTAANVLTAALIGWFLLARPYVHVTGDVGVDGSVSVEGAVRVRPADDDIFKVAVCDKWVDGIHCASLDQNTLYGTKSYALSVVPHNQ